MIDETAAALNIKAIFFDVGDTLVFDTPPLQRRLTAAFFRAGITALEGSFEEAYRAAEDFALGRYLEGVPFDDPEQLKACLNVMLSRLSLSLAPAEQNAILRYFLDAPYERFLHPQALDLLGTLKARGFTLGVISDWESDLQSLLSNLGILPCFDSLSVSSLVGVTKPHAALFRHALENSRAAAAESLHIGDYYELDAAGADSVGMNTLHFDWKGRHPNGIYPRVTSFTDLIAYCTQVPWEHNIHQR